MWLRARSATLCQHPIFAASTVQPNHNRLCADQQLAQNKVMLGNDSWNLII